MMVRPFWSFLPRAYRRMVFGLLISAQASGLQGPDLPDCAIICAIRPRAARPRSCRRIAVGVSIHQTSPGSIAPQACVTRPLTAEDGHGRVESNPASRACGLAFRRHARGHGAGSRNRTGTVLSNRGILSPLRLPIPPCPRAGLVAPWRAALKGRSPCPVGTLTCSKGRAAMLASIQETRGAPHGLPTHSL